MISLNKVNIPKFRYLKNHGRIVSPSRVREPNKALNHSFIHRFLFFKAACSILSYRPSMVSIPECPIFLFLLLLNVY